MRFETKEVFLCNGEMEIEGKGKAPLKLEKNYSRIEDDSNGII